MGTANKNCRLNAPVLLRKNNKQPYQPEFDSRAAIPRIIFFSFSYSSPSLLFLVKYWAYIIFKSRTERGFTKTLIGQ